MTRHSLSADDDTAHSPVSQHHEVSHLLAVADEDDLPAAVAPSSNTHVDGRIQAIHFVLGCAVLLPWNALITATPFFLSRMAGTALQSTFSSYLSISFTLTNFLVLARATITSKESSPTRRIVTSTSVLTCLTFLLTLSTYTPLPPLIYFLFVILNGMAQASAGSFLQTAVVAIAALFGPVAMQAAMSGQAFVGVVVSGVQLLSAVASISASSKARVEGFTYDQDGAEARAAALFFGLSTLFLLFTLAAHAYLIRMSAYRTVAHVLERAKLEDEGEEEEERHGILSREGEEPTEKGQLVRVAKMNAMYEVAVAYVFVVTLAVFPPITTSVQPTNQSIHPLVFTSAHFFVFNLGDLIGRYLCLVPRLLIWEAKPLLALSLLRTLFIPLFLACNIQRPAASPSTAAAAFVFGDWGFFALTLLFGSSNGFLASMGMMAAPSLVHNPALKSRRHADAERDVEAAATLAGFFLIGGLALGSAASFVVRGWVCGCNPFRE